MIYEEIHESIHTYGCIQISPVITKTGTAYDIFKSGSLSDARSFEGLVGRKRCNKQIDDIFHTLRWAVSSSSLLAGDEDVILHIQYSIMNT